MQTIVGCRVTPLADTGRVVAHLQCMGSPAFTMSLDMDRLTALQLGATLCENAATLPAPAPVVMRVDGVPPTPPEP